MRLIVDDIRDLGCDVIVRTPEAAMELLTKAGFLFEAICLDHDLGRELTGYDVLKYGLESETLPKRVQIVTQNPVGRDRMTKLLQDYGYVCTNGVDWIQ
jgi:CheY-like chemotaxis protein